MVVDVKPQRVENYSESGVKRLITRYNNAKAVKDMWLPTFEECYEFALPQRESFYSCLLYTSPSPRDGLLSRMPSSA